MSRIRVPETPIGKIILCVPVLFISGVFIFQYRDYAPITRDDAQTYSGDFRYYEIVNAGKNGRTEYLDIYLADETVLRLHHTCVNNDVTNTIDRIKSGDKVTALVNPESDYVIELLWEDTEIMSVDESQKRMQNEAKGFVILGVVMICFALFVMAVTVYEIVRSKKKKGKA